MALRTLEVCGFSGAFPVVVTADEVERGKPDPEIFPETLTIALEKADELRYGENAHQRAVLYGEFLDICELHHGKALSYNNLVDASRDPIDPPAPAPADGAAAEVAASWACSPSSTA